MNQYMNDSNFTLRDESGELFCNNNQISLKLNSENGRVRKIGEIQYKQLENGNVKKVYFKNEKNEDIFKKTDAWSIYHEILLRVDTIMYQTNDTIYYISSKIAKKHGSFLFFKTTGIEKKIYVPRVYWEQYDLKGNLKHDPWKELIGG